MCSGLIKYYDGFVLSSPVENSVTEGAGGGEGERTVRVEANLSFNRATITALPSISVAVSFGTSSMKFKTDGKP